MVFFQALNACKAKVNTWKVCVLPSAPKHGVKSLLFIIYCIRTVLLLHSARFLWHRKSHLFTVFIFIIPTVCCSFNQKLREYSLDIFFQHDIVEYVSNVFTYKGITYYKAILFTGLATHCMFLIFFL